MLEFRASYATHFQYCFGDGNFGYDLSEYSDQRHCAVISCCQWNPITGGDSSQGYLPLIIRLAIRGRLSVVIVKPGDSAMMIAVNPSIPRRSARGDRSMDAKFWWGTYRGTVAKSSYILFIFNVYESLGNQNLHRLDFLALP